MSGYAEGVLSDELKSIDARLGTVERELKHLLDSRDELAWLHSELKHRRANVVNGLRALGLNVATEKIEDPTCSCVHGGLLGDHGR
jgi:hypothetical protein